MFIVSFMFVIVGGLSVWKRICAGFLSFGYIICIYIGDPIIKRALNRLNRFNSAISFVPVQNRDLDFQDLFKCCVCVGERCSFFFYISRNGDRRCLSFLFINLSKTVCKIITKDVWDYGKIIKRQILHEIDQYQINTRVILF